MVIANSQQKKIGSVGMFYVNTLDSVRYRIGVNSVCKDNQWNDQKVVIKVRWF